ncbi:DNA primase [Indivirus ILV1]|uniref:DNA primase n=1 Tax=Indivirus ILV1 TaxID=1977633 RepID=A0A1V0SEG2_9VIRU|nr:DNA primase [Indivirus ILV1]
MNFTIDSLLKDVPYRYIKVWRDEKGLKKTADDHSNYTIEQIFSDKGNIKTSNYYSFYLKHTDIFCLDLDQKEFPDQIKKLMDEFKIPYTESKNGFHLYFKSNIEKFSNEIDLFKNFQADLIHYIRNMWEPYNNKVFNSNIIPFIDKDIILPLMKKKKLNKKKNNYKNVKGNKTIIDILNDSQSETVAYLYNQNKDKIIMANSDIYIYDDNTKLWVKTTNNQFINFMSKYISSEIENVRENEKNNREKDLIISKAKYKYTGYRYLQDIINQLKGFIQSENYWEKLDSCRHEINFKNGIYDLKNAVFRERSREDYVTKCLDFDYTDNVNEKINSEIHKMIFNISNDDLELKEFNLAWLGYCMTGETRERKMLFVIGHSAENGKSSLGRMFMYSLPIYSTEIDNKTFNENYTKVHKQLSGVNKPIRFIIIEELNKAKLDVFLFKKFVDGNEITNEEMYATTEKLCIHGKLYITSNNDPRFITDSGVLRRGIEIILKNRFLSEDDYNESKNKKGIYKKDPNFDEKFQLNNEYKMEFIRILLPYAKKYYDEKKLTIPNNIKKNFKELCDENDAMKTFIDKYYEQTNNDDDRIHKNDFVDLYNQDNKTKLSWAHLMSDAKRLGLIYKNDGRVKGAGTKAPKGVIVGLKLIDDDEFLINNKNKYEFIDDSEGAANH